MKENRIIMGMPVVVEIVDSEVTQEIFYEVFNYLVGIDERFSTYKSTSEITVFNEGKIKEKDLSEEMKTVFRLSEETKEETKGFFNINYNGKCDPSGLVKGWAIHNASELIRKKGYKNFYFEIAGDIEVEGLNKEGKYWSIGIRNPFNENEIIKVLYLKDCGIATSGTYIRGEHVYNPKEKKSANEIVSLTVIGKNVYEADRFATAAFAMGKKGIEFIESITGLEGYMIDHNGIATYTSNFMKYTHA